MPRTCKICKSKFEPKFNQVQLVCSIECAMKYSQIQKEKSWRKEKKEIKQSLKTKKDYEKELEYVFNEFIRLRDADKPCISCRAPKGTYRITAGHYFPQGSNKNIRFDEMNVHGQCWFNCNKNQHGNLSEYRLGLVERFSEEYVRELEAKRNVTRHYSIPELIELKVIYKDKVKQLKTQKL